MSAFPAPGRVPGRWAMVLALSVLVSGCSTAQIDAIPQELGGLPAGTPERPAVQPAYPAVHDMPPPRAASVLDAEQQMKLEADLIAIRNRQPNQRKTIAREKAKAKKARAPKGNGNPSRERNKPRQQAAPAPAGGPPWPLPPQTTGGSQRP